MNGYMDGGMQREVYSGLREIMYLCAYELGLWKKVLLHSVSSSPTKWMCDRTLLDFHILTCKVGVRTVAISER